jgi:hypothetical protein
MNPNLLQKSQSGSSARCILELQFDAFLFEFENARMSAANKNWWFSPAAKPLMTADLDQGNPLGIYHCRIFLTERIGLKWKVQYNLSYMPP